jgi:glycosidase
VGNRLFVVFAALVVALPVLVLSGGGLARASGSSDEALARPSYRHPVQNEQFYFVMPDRFENGSASNDTGGLAGGTSDEDVLRHGYDPELRGYYHGGDIAGLREKLDYLDDMGVSAVWMTPMFKNKPVQGDGTIAGSSAGYHGYWITDFTRIDPHMGTNRELQALIDEAHDRGMKVFFDIITNHTADVIRYKEGQYSYISKAQEPYRTASGKPFDDRDYAGTEEFPELDPQVSFPYTPVVPRAERDVKEPDWLDNRIYYHNRGDTDFQNEDEDQQYGDFVGLDDLFTEHPRVAQGMVDVYNDWVDYGVDGFRIDTVKHVNTEFWQKFGPEVLAHAKATGNEDFFMYGEVYSYDPSFTSIYTTEARLQAILDFPFQGAAREFASQGEPTRDLRDFFRQDDYYTDADSNAYSLPTFLGNHDMGRFGYFLEQDNDGATDRELLKRDRLGHALMYFARGMPVVYYGDEQGFTGGDPGNDQLARQDMFPTRTDEYKDDDQIGSGATPADNNFDRDHPLYQTLQDLAAARQEHNALRRGAQIQRYSDDQAGIYAFSRIARGEQVEYVVALNNAETTKTATFDTATPKALFEPVYGARTSANADAEGNLDVEVPALGAIVYRADREIPASPRAPRIQVSAPQTPTGRFEISARLSNNRYNEVSFAVKAGDGRFKPAGTDDNAPYRIFYHASNRKPGTTLTIKAVVDDLNGHLRSDSTTTTVVQ